MATVKPPTPAEAFELAEKHATLLRQLYSHPEFKYLEPPTAAICKTDPDTHPALFWATDFVQNTYVDYILPFLPEGATRKCKALGNPWAYADPDYQWEWQWDAEARALKDAAGNAVPFPELREQKATKLVRDITSRTVMAEKILLGSQSDPMVRMMFGGREFDFGEDIKQAAKNLGVGDSA